MEWDWIRTVGDPWDGWRPSDFGGIGPNHGAVEVPPRSLYLFPAFGLANWSREDVHFVRASRDVYGDFQSSYVRLEIVSTFWEDRLEHLWNHVGRTFIGDESLPCPWGLDFRTGVVASLGAEEDQKEWGRTEGGGTRLTVQALLLIFLVVPAWAVSPLPPPFLCLCLVPIAATDSTEALVRPE